MEIGRVDRSTISWRSLLGFLSRGGGAYTKVTLKGAYMLGIERAWRREHGVPLIYPMGDFEPSTAITSLRQLLQEGPLSSLRTLEVMKGRIDQGRVDLGGIFLRAVGISGCPVLEELLLHNLSYSPDLPAIVEMLVRRGPRVRLSSVSNYISTSSTRSGGTIWMWWASWRRLYKPRA